MLLKENGREQYPIDIEEQILSFKSSLYFGSVTKESFKIFSGCA